MKSYIIWEDDFHIAFLSIFPNTPGVTVVIPKKHHSSYIFDMPNDLIFGLMSAAKTVANILDKALNVGRCALVFEGLGVDHLHAKLFPLHGTKKNESWKPIKSNDHKSDLPFFDYYQGYISSHDCNVSDAESIESIAKKIVLYQRKESES